MEICYNNGTSDPANFSDRTAGYIEGNENDGNIMWQDSIDCAGNFTGNNLGYFSQGLRPQARFNLTNTGNPPAAIVNTSKTESFGPNSNLLFYSNDSILARIKNLSAFNFGCTQVIIDRDGIGAVPFLTTDTSMYLMNKTFRVLPTTNNIAGSYEITFYFTGSQVTSWQTATGQSFNNIQLVKVQSQIDNVRPNTPNGGGNIEVITPSARGTIGPNYFLTATITTGFSGFGFGTPYGTLPVGSLTFNGKLQGDNALLEWTTVTEQNTKNFEIQKSYDGVTYRTVGTLKAAGNSNRKQTYTFLDREFALDLNYYRLNTVDNDNKNKLSNVVILKNGKTRQSMVVVNNPFRDYIEVRFGKVPQGKVKLQLTDLSGKLIQAETFNGLSNNLLRFNLSSKTLSKGIYALSAEVDGTRYSVKVMKQ